MYPAGAYGGAYGVRRPMPGYGAGMGAMSLRPGMMPAGHQMGMGGAPGTAPQVPGQPSPADNPDDAAARRLQERQALSQQGFALLGQLLQLGAILANSGHQILSVAVGTTFAVRTARAMMGGGGAPAVGGPAGPSPLVAAAPSAVTASSGKQAGGARGLLGRVASSPVAIGAIVAALVILEHLVRLWWHRQQRRRLEEEERLLGIEHNDDEATGSPAGSPLEDRPAASQELPRGSNTAATTYVARFAFEAEASNQLSLQPGDQLCVAEYRPDGWCWAKATGVRRGAGVTEGFVPGNYIEALVPKRRL